MTASSRPGSEKTNIFTRSDFCAPAIAARIPLAESSGITMIERAAIAKRLDGDAGDAVGQSELNPIEAGVETAQRQ